jgi:hypothetical protein
MGLRAMLHHGYCYLLGAHNPETSEVLSRRFQHLVKPHHVVLGFLNPLIFCASLIALLVDNTS